MTRTKGDAASHEAAGAGPVAGLLLAAGGGRRLGGRPKALLPYRGRPLVERAVAALRAGGCGPVQVVLGAAAEEVRRRAELSGCLLAENPDWASGMGSSLRTGLAALAGTEASAALVMLVDQPRIGPEVVARLVAAHRSGAALVAATYGGERGHPVLFAREHWAGVAAAAAGDRGARDFLRAHEAELTRVECGDIAAPDDIDTPEDLALLD
ncbi:nucleotidyltransferase family protein [Streptomyces sp. XD-27]|uniref:nucleotidyltransferase family protein n=1 Tax=Streptomyces sp. XD-27 TaxID=3062779 RepID=UPI0026F4780F|nr:nucleotidyltransferase family protein [Streptomyces sp. XD-27]WKX73180.1 nucleotidyltransferase family protein [Streptomyces sp. XD-27]